MYHDRDTTEIIQGLHNYEDEANYTDKRGAEERLGAVPVKCKAERARGFGASWPADPAGLTFCTSDGTLDRKSSTSLLSMLYGFRSLLVNLLIPKTEIHTNVSLQLVSGGCALCFHTNTNTCRGETHCSSTLYFHFVGCSISHSSRQ